MRPAKRSPTRTLCPPRTRTGRRHAAASPPGLARPELVLHAAAWTDVDAAEADPQGAAQRSTSPASAHAAALGAPLVAFSTDYASMASASRMDVDGPNPLSAYGGRSCRRGGGGRTTRGSCGPRGCSARRGKLRPHDAAPGRGAGRGVSRRRPAWLDVRRPPSRRPYASPWMAIATAASGTSPPTATAHGRTSRRRCSKRRGSTAVCGGSLATS